VAAAGSRPRLLDLRLAPAASPDAPGGWDLVVASLGATPLRDVVVRVEHTDGDGPPGLDVAPTLGRASLVDELPPGAVARAAGPFRFRPGVRHETPYPLQALAMAVDPRDGRVEAVRLRVPPDRLGDPASVLAEPDDGSHERGYWSMLDRLKARPNPGTGPAPPVPPGERPDPVATLVWTRANHHRLRRTGEGALALVSTWGRVWAWVAAAWFALLAVVVAALSLELGPGGPGAFGLTVAILLGLLALGLPPTLAGIGPLHAQAHFDRDAGLLRLAGWRFQDRPTIRLDRIEAVQLLDAGPRDDEGTSFASYQLNLVLVDAPDHARRLNLLHNGDREALRAIGGEVAGFLGIPFVAT
jgi:hypothetical protein